jgi:hypothetical protein
VTVYRAKDRHATNDQGNQSRHEPPEFRTRLDGGNHLGDEQWLTE